MSGARTGWARKARSADHNKSISQYELSNVEISPSAVQSYIFFTYFSLPQLFLPIPEEAIKLQEEEDEKQQ